VVNFHLPTGVRLILMLGAACAGVAVVFVGLVYLQHVWRTRNGKPPVEEGDLTHTSVACPCLPEKEALIEVMSRMSKGDGAEDSHWTPAAGSRKLERGTVVRVIELGPTYTYVRIVADRTKCWVATEWLAR